MKLVKQIRLEYREGTSDKVYEVDLCEVGDGQFVVNFRYGRRGANLKDGSKTVLPVSRDEAERVFDKLVLSKTKKGYREAGAAPAPTPAPARSPAPAPSPQGLTARERAVLEQLQNRARLSRAMWRAAELELAAAEPLLLEIHREGRVKDGISQYTLAYALGRCGSARSVAALEGIHRDPSATPQLRRVAAEGLLRIADPAGRERLVQAEIARLPASLSSQIDDAEALAGALATAVRQSDRAQGIALVHGLYLIDTAPTRAALFAFFEGAGPDEKNWTVIRQLFKAAEARRDGEMFGGIARWIERAPSTRVSYWYYGRRDNSNTPFTSITKSYLRRRIWRTLRRLGELEHPDFVKMAVGVLTAYSDRDAQVVRRSESWGWSGNSNVLTWDRYAGYWCFNQLLYRHSPRYHADKHGKAWRCTAPYKPGDPAPNVREEAFPHLWDREPRGLLHLLAESECEVVHQFGVRALRSQTRFLREIGVDAIVMLLGRPYAITADLGFELAEKHYDPQNPDIDFLVAIVSCASSAAREKARAWINAQRARFAETTKLVCALASSPHADNRDFVRALLGSTLIADAKKREIFDALIATLSNLGEEPADYVSDVGGILLECFAPQIAAAGIGVIRTLLESPSGAVQSVAGRMLLAQPAGTPIPDEVLVALINASDPQVRSLGAQLVGQLGDEQLSERIELVIQLSEHAQAEIRAAVRPAIGRIVSGSTELGRPIVAAFVAALTRDGEPEVHAHLLALLKEELRGLWGQIDKDAVWRLIHATSSAAQELGGLLMAQTLTPDDLSVRQLVELASHDVRAVRASTWRLAEGSLPRLKQAMVSTVKFLDAKWDDSRQWAFEFFEKQFGPSELSPSILVAICDSVREDVQQFGQRLITRYFEDASGEEYLLKLSEHPTPRLQLFATNYLSRFASGRPDRLPALEHYFTSILSRVNKGRVTKARVLEFLEREAIAHRDAAAFIAPLITRQSVTMAVEDKARCIEVLLAIHRTHGDIELPIRVRAEEVRGAV